MRVAIVDDNPIDRLNLRTLLGQIREVEIVGEADGCASGQTLIETQKPDVIFSTFGWVGKRVSSF